MRYLGLLLAVLAVGPADAAEYVHVYSIGGPDGFDHPYDVAIRDGTLYVDDSHHNRVQVFDLDGTFRFAFGETGSGDGQFRRNRGIAITPGGTTPAALYVTDAKNDRVQRFLPDGTHTASWGSIGAGDDQFFRPRGITVTPDGSVVVCDADNHRFKIHRPDLSLRAIVGGQGSGPGEFFACFDVDVSPAGELHVVDVFNQRIQVFDPDGAFLRMYGEAGPGPGQFVKPWSIAIGPDGRIFVGDTRDADHEVERVHVFDAAGNHLTTFGEPGTGTGQLRQPAGLTVDAQGRVFVADVENHRIAVWAPVPVATSRTSMSRVKGAFAP